MPLAGLKRIKRLLDPYFVTKGRKFRLVDVDAAGKTAPSTPGMIRI
jgi:hypothetical protein